MLVSLDALALTAGLVLGALDGRARARVNPWHPLSIEPRADRSPVERRKKSVRSSQRTGRAEGYHVRRCRETLAGAAYSAFPAFPYAYGIAYLAEI